MMKIKKEKSMKYAMLMKIQGWRGTNYEIFEGGDVYELLEDFERIQDLHCLCSMGAHYEKKNKNDVESLYMFLIKRDNYMLEIEDLQDLVKKDKQTL